MAPLALSQDPSGAPKDAQNHSGPLKTPWFNSAVRLDEKFALVLVDGLGQTMANKVI